MFQCVWFSKHLSLDLVIVICVRLIDSIGYDFSQQTRYSESVINQGLQGGSASRNWMVVMVLCMAGGVVTMVAGLVVFVHGRRILKFQSRVVHEKL